MAGGGGGRRRAQQARLSAAPRLGVALVAGHRQLVLREKVQEPARGSSGYDAARCEPLPCSPAPAKNAYSHSVRMRRTLRAHAPDPLVSPQLGLPPLLRNASLCAQGLSKARRQVAGHDGHLWQTQNRHTSEVTQLSTDPARRPQPRSQDDTHGSAGGEAEHAAAHRRRGARTAGDVAAQGGAGQGRAASGVGARHELAARLGEAPVPGLPPLSCPVREERRTLLDSPLPGKHADEGQDEAHTACRVRHGRGSPAELGLRTTSRKCRQVGWREAA